MREYKRLVYGVGINDADYKTREVIQVNGKQVTLWTCPFYRKWRDMLTRCYSKKFHQRQPTYKGCIVSEEWLLFSNFRKWMVEQDWEKKELEKDLLVYGNKVYSAETCVFVTSQVNVFLTDSGKTRGEWPIGVYWRRYVGKFMAQCRNPFTGKRENLGYFLCPYEAHRAWLKRKLELAHQLAAIQSDTRVAQAVIDRYTNYTQTKGEYNE